MKKYLTMMDNNYVNTLIRRKNPISHDIIKVIYHRIS